MSYQGQDPNRSQYPNAGEYGQGYAPQGQQPDQQAGNQYYQPTNNSQPGNQYYQPGNTQQGGNPYYQPGAAQQPGNQYYQPGSNPQYQQPYNQQQWNAQRSPYTTLGLEPRLEAALCYALCWVSGLVIFFLEKQNRQVRFHAMQSILFFGGLNILMIVVGILPFIGALLVPLLILIGFAGWIGFMILAYTNNPLRIPYLSDYADRFTDQVKL